jgi:hypothetical protein
VAALAELEGIERERRVAWHNYLDLLGYLVIDPNNPLDPEDAIPIPSERMMMGPGPSKDKGKGKGKERAADPIADDTGAGASGSGAAEDDNADEVSQGLEEDTAGEGGSGSGRMDTS